MGTKFKTPTKCKKCFYSGPVNFIVDDKRLYSCDYLILTGARRPCPAGNTCTVYSPGNRKDRTTPNTARLNKAERKAKKDGALHH